MPDAGTLANGARRIDNRGLVDKNVGQLSAFGEPYALAPSPALPRWTIGRWGRGVPSLQLINILFRYAPPGKGIAAVENKGRLVGDGFVIKRVVICY